MTRGRWCRITDSRFRRLAIIGLAGISKPYISRKEKGPDFRPALLVLGFIRPHPGAQKGGAATLGSLSRPRHGQNPYANPERTAKSVMPVYLAYATIAINNYLGTTPPGPAPGKARGHAAVTVSAQTPGGGLPRRRSGRSVPGFIQTGRVNPLFGNDSTAGDSGGLGTIPALVYRRRLRSGN